MPVVYLEAWALLRVFTWRRFFAGVRLVATYLLSLVLRRPVNPGYPLAFAIEPTSICNLRCPECPTGANLLKRPRGLLDMALYRQVLEQLKGSVLYLNLYVQGEPFMHPRFTEMVRMAAARRMYTSTSTNGHFIDRRVADELVKAGLTRLIFSLDGATQQTYSQYRVNGNLEKVLSAIRYVSEAKISRGKHYPLLVVQFLVFQHNEHELSAVKKLVRDLGVDQLEIKTAQLHDYGTMLPPTNAALSRYKAGAGRQLKYRVNNRCWRQWHSAVMTWEGQVAPCCYDKDVDHPLGQVPDEPLEEIWKGEKSRVFKGKILRERQNIGMCRNCPEGKALF